MEKYNEKQIEAINSDNNVTIVIAGAGSGKTTVLIERIAKLLDSGVSPHNILAITFTNKAAKEMRERLIAKSGPIAFECKVMTFHAFSLRIIKNDIDLIEGYNRNFLIIDTDDQKKIIKNILKDLNKDLKVPDVLSNIGYAKSISLTYKNVEMLIAEEYREVYNEYRDYCRQNNAFDFDDLLLQAYALLKNKEICQKYNKQFKYILVDEFQDTSLIQGEILKKIKTQDNNLFIVGDIDQSIYTWRGATIDNLLNLQDDYENSKMIKLEQNYRSTKKILESANKLIANNEKRIDKNLWTENKSGRKIQYYSVNTNIDEAATVVREINSIVDYGGSYDEFAILYRYNYQSRKMEEILMKNRIPYKIFGGIRFYERMEIKDILAYLRLFINPNDNISLLRVINTPKRKVGDKTIEKIRIYAQENQLSLFQAIEELEIKNLNKFIKIIKKYKHIIDIENSKTFLEEFGLFLEELEYEKYLLTQDDKSKVEERMNNIRELKEGLAQEIELENDMKDYINEISLFKETEEDSDDMVILSTIHGVKGLEFENVFMIGMIEGKFPKENAIYNIEEMEEERRLAYVGITRAKNLLTLTSYRYDFKYEEQKPSRFLEEMGIDIGEDDNLDNFIF